MIKFPLSTIIEKIKEKTDISEEELNSKIEDKMKQLSGLISKEGAAHIIANELGVKLLEETSGKLQIKNVLAGMRDVETVGKIQQISGISEFQRKDGTPGKVASIVIADETGSIRIVLWGSQTDLLNELKEDLTVKVIGGYVRENNNRLEVHLNESSKLIPNPEGENVGEVKKYTSQRKKIGELKENDKDIELLGTVVQAFEPRFFEVCPECNKRARQRDGGFFCEEHNIVNPNYSYVVNLVLDDGSETIRTVFFTKQAENLLELNKEQILGYKDNPEKFEEVKAGLVGKIIKIIGRVNKNDMFDRLEFVARLVFPNPDPGEEIDKLKKEFENNTKKEKAQEESSEKLPTVEEI
ncbi:MAG: OB-fold nucleic acid binding domain-containing protein [Nanoarchaeota archaeon]|nr:OB-fold nucleic acid binding domain-containing protein [Nanoarchaeota archaeon]